MPRVSVIIPTYNSAAFVGRAIQSALDQTYTDLEVIVVDDGSTDDTPTVLKGFGSRIQHFRQENLERSAARNRGLAAANGEYVAFLDADDAWLPHKTSTQVAYLEAHPDVGLAYGQMKFVDDMGRSTGRRLHCTRADRPAHDVPFHELALGNVIGSPSATMLRASVLSQSGPFDLDVKQGVEDWDLWLRVALHSAIRFLPGMVTSYRLHGGNAMERMDKRGAQDAWIDIVNRVFRSLDDSVATRDLHRRALARAHLRGALVDIGLGRKASALVRLRTALEQDRELGQPRSLEVADRAIAFAQGLYLEGDALGASLAYLDQVYATMAAAIPSTARGRRLAKGRLCAGLTFSAYENRDWPILQETAWRAALYDPAWLANLGLLSIATRSLAQAALRTFQKE